MSYLDPYVTYNVAPLHSGEDLDLSVILDTGRSNLPSHDTELSSQCSIPVVKFHIIALFSAMFCLQKKKLFFLFGTRFKFVCSFGHGKSNPPIDMKEYSVFCALHPMLSYIVMHSLTGSVSRLSYTAEPCLV
jgi:hypothetical protein